ncbi:hypothetical protein [Nocardioides caldifontis]|nr:hypothetical protein [Nocardioides caldifontis]
MDAVLVALMVVVFLLLALGALLVLTKVMKAEVVRVQEARATTRTTGRDR